MCLFSTPRDRGTGLRALDDVFHFPGLLEDLSSGVLDLLQPSDGLFFFRQSCKHTITAVESEEKSTDEFVSVPNSLKVMPG